LNFYTLDVGRTLLIARMFSRLSLDLLLSDCHLQ